MKHVLVLGANGMLGHTVFDALSQVAHLRVWGSYRSQPSQIISSYVHFDLVNGIQGLEETLSRIGQCHYIINCIALLKGDIDESNEESVKNAMLINTLFPHELAYLGKQRNIRILHVSTDGVFSGLSSHPYLETAHTDAEDLYGKSKILGEAIGEGVINIRCSLIGLDPYRHRGLLEWFLAQKPGSSLTGYADHYWNGVTTLQFAQLCAKIILGDQFARVRQESPIHHFVPNKSVTKVELLEIFKDTFHRDVSISKSLSPAGPSSRILGTRFHSLREIFGQSSLEEALEELAADQT